MSPALSTLPAGDVSSGLPLKPALYELEYHYWPWGDLLARVEEWILRRAPRNAHVVDYMCGTGYLLGRLGASRSDMVLRGVDISEPYIRYGRQRYERVSFEVADVLDYSPPAASDVVVCTAGLHHVPLNRQAEVLQGFAAQLAPGGLLLLGEEVVPASVGPDARARAVALLWSELLRYSMMRDAPREILLQAAEVLRADLRDEEWKVSRCQLARLVERHFTVVEEHWVWQPGQANYGDVFLVCRPHAQHRR